MDRHAILGTDGLPMRSFDASSAGSSGKERLEHLRWQMAGSAEVIPAGSDVSGFAAKASTWLLDSAVFIASELPALTMSRPAALVRAGQLDQYVLQFNGRSGLEVDADGHRIRVPGAQVILKDLARPESIRLGGPGPDITMLLPRDELDALLPKAFDLHGVVLAGTAASLLHSHLLALRAQLSTMRITEAEGAKNATLHLLAASLAPSLQSLGLARPAIESSLLRQIRRYIEENLSRRDLDALHLCAQFRVARSTLYRLFEPLGGISRYVQERRLAGVYARLSGAHGDTGRRYLGQIADDFGFASASHFSRAFRQQYGHSPSETREIRAGRPAVRRIAGPAAPTPGRFRFGDWSFGR